MLILEDNLMWGPRLRQTVAALGHEPILSAVGEFTGRVEAAIINLGARAFDPSTVIEQLKSAGIYVIGHAGHKEKELLEAGRRAGCDQILSNGQTTFQLAKALALVDVPDSPS